jgi:phospholipase/lecithinase/hemolysin
VLFWQNYVEFIAEIVALMKQSLEKLYSLGLRNIMVTTLAPMNCLPLKTILTNFTACSSNATVDDVESLHNSYLQTTLERLSKDLPGINFILLRLDDALKDIQNNMTLFNITEPLKPCCLGYCGGVDRTGNLLYTLCENPENHVVWDDVHPTEAAWENVANLYANGEAYPSLAPTLQHWAGKLP